METALLSRQFINAFNGEISLFFVFIYELLNCGVIVCCSALSLESKGKRRVTYAVFLFWAVVMAIFSAIIQYLGEYRDYVSYAFQLAMLIPVLNCCKDTVAKKVFVFCSAFFFEISFFGIFRVLSCVLFGSYYFGLGVIPILIRIAIGVLSVFCYYLFRDGIRSAAKREIKDETYFVLTLFPLIYIMFLVLIFVKNTVYPVEDDNMLSFTVWAITGFFVYFFLERYIIMSTENAEIEREIDMINRFTEMEKQYFNLLNESLYKAKILRHDIRHHIATLGTLNKSGDSEAVERYLNAMLDDIGSGEVKRLCVNDELNIVLSYYASKAEELGVKLSFKLDLPSALKIDIIELTVIWGNILENALRAVTEDNDVRQTKEIEVICRYIDDKLIMMEKNAFYGRLNRDINGDFVTTKEKGGLGLKSIRAIAEKHDGDLTVCFEDNVYSIYVSLEGVI